MDTLRLSADADGDKVLKSVDTGRAKQAWNFSPADNRKPWVVSGGQRMPGLSSTDFFTCYKPFVIHRPNRVALDRSRISD